MSLSTDIWVWVGVLLTFCIYSFLYKDNPFYKFGEHLFVGVANGWTLAFMVTRVIIPVMYHPFREAWQIAGEEGVSAELFNPIAPANFLIIIPGLILWARYFSRRTRALSHHRMERQANVTRRVQESLASTSLIKAFASEEREVERVMSEIDVYVCPSFGGDNLLMTNLTGHPCVVVPNGFRASDGTPTSISFMGRLQGEAELLSVARAYQQATDFHLRRPPLEAGSAIASGTKP